MRVRRAVLADAAAIAAVHVASWEETYEELLPAGFIAAHTFAVRLAFWTDCLEAADPAVCVFVAVAENGKVCGFASGGPERSGLLPAGGELYALYLLDRVQGSGLGRRLVEAVKVALGDSEIAVWVMTHNPARSFYEHLGGRRITERQVVKAGARFSETAYTLSARKERSSAEIGTSATVRSEKA